MLAHGSKLLTMSSYKDYGYSTENWNHIHAYVLQPLLKILGEKKDRVILDLGCGNGWLVNHLIELGYNAYGTDASESGIELAKKRNRERFFLAGHNSDFEFPEPETKKNTVGDAIADLITTIPEESKFLTAAQDVYIANYERASKCINPRDLYADRPARTLTCRNLSAATGDMQRVKLPDGRRRRLLIREAARLQSFPDSFVFTGAETSQFYQIGNAVPPLLAYKMALAVKECYNKTNVPQKQLELEYPM